MKIKNDAIFDFDCIRLEGKIKNWGTSSVLNPTLKPTIILRNYFLLHDALEDGFKFLTRCYTFISSANLQQYNWLRDDKNTRYCISDRFLGIFTFIILLFWLTDGWMDLLKSLTKKVVKFVVNTGTGKITRKRQNGQNLISGKISEVCCLACVWDVLKSMGNRLARQGLHAADLAVGIPFWHSKGSYNNSRVIMPVLGMVR